MNHPLGRAGSAPGKPHGRRTDRGPGPPARPAERSGRASKSHSKSSHSVKRVTHTLRYANARPGRLSRPTQAGNVRDCGRLGDGQHRPRPPGPPAYERPRALVRATHAPGGATRRPSSLPAHPVDLYTWPAREGRVCARAGGAPRRLWGGHGAGRAAAAATAATAATVAAAHPADSNRLSPQGASRRPRAGR